MQRNLDKELSEIRVKLEEWRAERRLEISHQRAGLLGNLCEELKEYYRAQNEHEKVDGLCDIVVFSLNGIERPQDFSGFSRKDGDGTMSVVFTIMSSLTQSITDDKLAALAYEAYMMIEDMGYDAYKAMGETIKEISSRTGAYNESIGKWVKDKSEAAMKKWYKADYSKCKKG